MSYQIDSSRHFVPWTDPESKVKSFILAGRVAPVQQSFYFVNSSMSNDGRYLWFYCAFPPSGDEGYGRTLAVLDFHTDEIYHYPETQFLTASPLVDVETGEVYWCNRHDIWKRGPRPEDGIERVARFPSELKGKGTMQRMATHLTFSADKRELCFDAEIGNRTYVGSVSLETGDFTVWQEFEGGYAHAQFNPVDPDLILFAKEYWMQKESGERHGIERDSEGKLKRLWVIRRGEEAQPIKPKWEEASHEWWSSDGKCIYYVDWKKGIVKIDLQSNEKVHVYPYMCRHGHASSNDSYFTADDFLDDPWYRGCRTNVSFYNGITKKRIDIMTELPTLYTRDEPCVYHIDPHPRFTRNDDYIIFTTTVLGRVDVAITKVSDLIEMTS